MFCDVLCLYFDGWYVLFVRFVSRVPSSLLRDTRFRAPQRMLNVLKMRSAVEETDEDAICQVILSFFPAGVVSFVVFLCSVWCVVRCGVLMMYL